jgi:hypothetical protein
VLQTAEDYIGWIHEAWDNHELERSGRSTCFPSLRMQEAAAQGQLGYHGIAVGYAYFGLLLVVWRERETVDNSTGLSMGIAESII